MISLLTSRAVGILVALIVCVVLVWWGLTTVYQQGYDARIADEARAIKEKVDASNRADDAARRCSADPACRLRVDPYRRD